MNRLFVRRYGSLALKIWIFGFSMIGFFTVVGPVACSAVRPAVYEDQEFAKVRAPNGPLAAYRKVTRGGFGTVWTTRIFVVNIINAEESLVYENGDSEFIPNIRWVNGETLALGLPCGRIDHIANPQDFDKGTTPLDRFAVQIEYVKSCAEVAKESTE